MGDDLAGKLRSALEGQLGAGVTVAGLHPLSSGASRRSWRFEAAVAGQPPRRYVLQREMSAGATGRETAEPLRMAAQAALLRAAGAAGVPVPEVVASGEMEGLQYIVTGWLDGEALPPRMLRDPELAGGRLALMADCARALSTIHHLPPDGLELAARDPMVVYRTALDALGEPRPVLELAYRWLMTNRPEPVPAVVVHGDFRLGNLLVGPGGLQAVLDWELAHLGDRHEDVAWATLRPWRFDHHRERGIFPEPADWVDAYDAQAGPEERIEPDRLRWWQIAGTWMWAVMSGMQARRHLDGWVQSLEHATIGRRVCESEWDLLELLP